MNNNLCIHPIATDLGAANTGVYSAHYKAGCKPENIARSGKVYKLDSSKYTLLMKSRTANRHQRRGYDRRQLAKRLFRLIWTKELDLEWNAETAQAIGFIMNRRGFSFLTGEYDLEVLSRFPDYAWQKLPEEFRCIALNSGTTDKDGVYDLTPAFQFWSQSDSKEIYKALKPVLDNQKKVKDDLFFYGRVALARRYIDFLQNKTALKKNDEKNIKVFPCWVLEKMQKDRVAGLPELTDKKPVDLGEYFKNNPKSMERFIDTSGDYSAKESEAKKSLWNFSDKFDLGKNRDNFDSTKENVGVKTHLHHLYFAMDSVYKELSSGAMYRKKYFDEVREALAETGHKHKYLKNFCEKLHSSQLGKLDIDKLCNLIGHVANMELKPLRKYFNDEGHRVGDYWDGERLKKFFDHWICREWRVKPDKNPEKANGKEQDYSKLLAMWKSHTGTVVDFWLNTSALYTIPPYQNINNRQPPRCQSLILNAHYLDRHYPKWKEWLEFLKKNSGDYLGTFREDLNGLRSGSGNPYFTDDFSGEAHVDS